MTGTLHGSESDDAPMHTSDDGGTGAGGRRSDSRLAASLNVQRRRVQVRGWRRPRRDPPRAGSGRRACRSATRRLGVRLSERARQITTSTRSDSRRGRHRVAAPSDRFPPMHARSGAGNRDGEADGQPFESSATRGSGRVEAIETETGRRRPRQAGTYASRPPAQTVGELSRGPAAQPAPPGCDEGSSARTEGLERRRVGVLPRLGRRPPVGGAVVDHGVEAGAAMSAIPAAQTVPDAPLAQAVR